MSNRNYPPVIGMGLPGQREGRRSDIKTDLVLVRKQTGDNIVLWTGIFLSLFSIVLIIGPLFGYILGIIAFIAIYIYLRFLTYQYEQPVPSFGVIIGLSLLGFWTLAGYAITDRFWWDVRCEWEPRNKLVLVIFLLGFAAILFLNMYRFSYEVADPNWSPTIEVRPAEWGILWPWVKPEMPPDMEPEVIETIKEIPRPYAVSTTANANVTDNLNPNRVTPDKTVLTTDGKEVDVKDLIYFVKRAPIIGATFRPWKKDGWKHERWKNVVRVWQVYGVVSANGERTTTEIVVTDLKEALKRLSSAFDDPPTPT